jgi:DnaK suppressor protein
MAKTKLKQKSKLAPATKDTARYLELKHILEDRRKDLIKQVQGRMRDGAQGNETTANEADNSVDDVQVNIELALIQMKSDTLNRIDAALKRLEDGKYGNCFQCHNPIEESRLRALPFAVRCKTCEEMRESEERRGRK